MGRSKIPPGEIIYQAGIVILLFTAIIAIGSRTIADPDLWGHLKFGLDFLESGTIPQFDPYSYLSAGQRWINHELIAEIAFAWVWIVGNVTGLILLKTIVVTLTIGLVFLYLIKFDISPTFSGILVLITFIGIIPATATVRPQMFTLMIMALLFIIISLAETGRYSLLWTAPLIFVLWVNFHGGFLAGLGFLVIWSLTHSLLHRGKWKSVLPPVMLSTFTIFINPYGTELITFLLRTATISRPQIVEWLPVSITSDLGLIYLGTIAIIILGLVFSRKDKPIPILILIIVAAILPLIAVRHLPLFSLAMGIFAGVHIADAWSRIPIKPSPKINIQNWLIALSAIISVLLIIWSSPNFSIIHISNDPVPKYPGKIMALLDGSEVHGNMVVGFNWGEYIIWHLGPDIKVSIDGRRETVYPEEIYAANLSFTYGYGNWDAILEEYDTNLVLIGRNEPPYNLMKLKPGWELIAEDEISALFAYQNWSDIGDLKEFAATFEPPPVDLYFP